MVQDILNEHKLHRRCRHKSIIALNECLYLRVYPILSVIILRKAMVLYASLVHQVGHRWAMRYLSHKIFHGVFTCKIAVTKSKTK